MSMGFVLRERPRIVEDAAGEMFRRKRLAHRPGLLTRWEQAEPQSAKVN
jgi:hypothetical protein